MKKNIALLLLAVVLMCTAKALGEPSQGLSCDPNNDEVGRKTVAYFNTLFEGLGKTAEKDPLYDSYREIMKPVAESTEGFYGGTLVGPDWVIVQVYYPSHFLARGFDLKKVKELTDFYKMMQEKPAPQLSEPGHGSIMQPRLIAMRYPVIRDGKVKNILSMMVRTEAYLKAVGLDKCSAYKITCKGKLAEEKGELAKEYKEVKLQLPSTEWTIQYQK
ncbi:MAG: hypothetical protein FJ263_00115 [Planctomycetes bacterium]|nr:hypothetical protein [Planctomycetota bacterium]